MPNSSRAESEAQLLDGASEETVENIELTPEEDEKFPKHLNAMIRARAAASNNIQTLQTMYLVPIADLAINLSPQLSTATNGQHNPTSASDSAPTATSTAGPIPSTPSITPSNFMTTNFTTEINSSSAYRNADIPADAVVDSMSNDFGNSKIGKAVVINSKSNGHNYPTSAPARTANSTPSTSPRNPSIASNFTATNFITEITASGAYRNAEIPAHVPLSNTNFENFKFGEGVVINHRNNGKVGLLAKLKALNGATFSRP